MKILITYDVNTETKKGQKRLRSVAQACKNYGQRVQKSVFECSLDNVKFEKLRKRFFEIIDEDKDSLRIYRLIGEREKYVEVIGIDNYIDFDAPLIM